MPVQTAFVLVQSHSFGHKIWQFAAASRKISRVIFVPYPSWYRSQMLLLSPFFFSISLLWSEWYWESDMNSRQMTISVAELGESLLFWTLVNEALYTFESIVLVMIWLFKDRYRHLFMLHFIGPLLCATEPRKASFNWLSKSPRTNTGKGLRKIKDLISYLFSTLPQSHFLKDFFDLFWRFIFLEWLITTKNCNFAEFLIRLYP